MNVFGAIRIGLQAPYAAAAFWRAMEDGRGPVAGAKAFAASTSSLVDDAAVQQLVDGVRWLVRAGDTAIAGVAWGVGALEASRPALAAAARVTQAVAARLADPALPQQVDDALGRLVDAGYRLGEVRSTLRRWLDA